MVSRVWLSPPESPARATREAAVLKISLLLNFRFYTEELCLCRDEGKGNIQTSLVKGVLPKSYQWEILLCIGSIWDYIYNQTK